MDGGSQYQQAADRGSGNAPRTCCLSLPQPPAGFSISNAIDVAQDVQKRRI